MSYSLGLCNLDSLSDVKEQIRRFDHPQRQLAGVERAIHVRVLLVQVAEHLHVQCVVGQGDVAVFWSNDIHAHDQRRLARCHETGVQTHEDLQRVVPP
jgi:hypothetical protein